MIRTLLVATSLAVVGCSSQGDPLVALSGHVQLDGKPVSDASIIFIPDVDKQGQGANATVWKGRYSIPAESGASPGEFHVLITDLRRDRSEPVGKGESSLVPERYAQLNELHVTIPPGRKSWGFDFELTTKPGPERAEASAPVAAKIAD